MPTMEVTKDAIWSYDSTKAPGYDGYNINFVEKLWHVIGNGFSKLVMDFFINDVFPS